MKRTALAALILLAPSLAMGAAPGVIPGGMNLPQLIIYLQGYYRRFPIGGGWQVTDVHRVRSSVVVEVAAAGGDYRSLMADSAAVRDMALRGILCPASTEARLWQLLGPAQLVYRVQPDRGNGPAVSISCPAG